MEIDHILVPGPVYPDHCDHPQGSYVGSYRLDEKRGDKWGEYRYDLYVYPDHVFGGSGVCIREGGDPGDYASCGNVLMFLRTEGQFGSKLPHYQGARMLLEHFGRVFWQPKTVDELVSERQKYEQAIGSE